MNLKRIKRWTPWIASVLIILVVFLLSAQSGDSSHDLSGRTTKLAMKFVGPVLDAIRNAQEWQLSVSVNFVLRKMTHVLIYFLLTFTIMLGFRSIFNKKTMVFAVTCLSVMFLAFVDEFHQLFVDGRGAGVSDVLLDLTGAMAAFVCALAFLVIRWISRWLSEVWPDREKGDGGNR